MTRATAVLAAGVALAAALTADAAARPRRHARACVDCHERKTPGVLAPWRRSAHARAGVGCPDCHGADYDANHDADHEARRARAPVTARVCATCHETEARAHAASRHGRSFRAGRACTRGLPRTPARTARCVDCHGHDRGTPSAPVECARFLPRSDAMKRQGCMSCHTIENRCDRCHTPHDTDLAIARAPQTCGTCHMGPDHAQYEMWSQSRHGVVFSVAGASAAPSCVGCHMPAGEHQVSLGIANRGAATDPAAHDKARALMLERCARCHTRRFAAANLADGDAIERESRAVLDDAATIIRDLDARDLLRPSPAQRPAHPIAGRRLVLDAQMLYENLSRVEAVYFRMAKFHYASAVKGAFHQNADYAHWFGAAPLRLGLSEIRSDAALLDQLWRLRQRPRPRAAAPTGARPQPHDPLARDLAELRRRYLAGELDARAYRAAKARLLDAAGL